MGVWYRAGPVRVRCGGRNAHGTGSATSQSVCLSCTRVRRAHVRPHAGCGSKGGMPALHHADRIREDSRNTACCCDDGPGRPESGLPNKSRRTTTETTSSSTAGMEPGQVAEGLCLRWNEDGDGRAVRRAPGNLRRLPRQDAPGQPLREMWLPTASQGAWPCISVSAGPLAEGYQRSWVS